MLQPDLLLALRRSADVQLGRVAHREELLDASVDDSDGHHGQQQLSSPEKEARLAVDFREARRKFAAVLPRYPDEEATDRNGSDNWPVRGCHLPAAIGHVGDVGGEELWEGILIDGADCLAEALE